MLEDSSQPVPLCNKCGEPLDARGQCVKCRSPQGAPKTASPPTKAVVAPKPSQSGILKSSAAAQRSAILKSGAMALPPLPDDDEIIELEEARPASPPRKPAAPTSSGAAQPKPKVKAPPLPPMAGPGKLPPQGKKPGKPSDVGEDEFWKAVES